MNTTPGAALTRLRSADPASSLPLPDPQDATARAMLERILTDRPSGAPERPRTHRRLLPAGIVATAAAATVVAGVVVTPWSHGRPAATAYAVAKHEDGTVGVTVHWDELRDPATLNSALARQGARTVVMPISAEGRCRTGFATDPAHPMWIRIHMDEHPELRDPAKFRAYADAQTPWIDYPLTDYGRGSAAFTIHPDEIPAGDTLLIPYDFSPDHSTGAGGSMLVPEVPACVPSNSDIVYTSSGVAVR